MQTKVRQTACLCCADAVTGVDASGASAGACDAFVLDRRQLTDFRMVFAPIGCVVASLLKRCVLVVSLQIVLAGLR